MLEFERTDVEDIKALFELVTGATYSSETLQRRLSLLTYCELRSVLSKLNKAGRLIQKAEKIIDERAHKEHDAWP